MPDSVKKKRKKHISEVVEGKAILQEIDKDTSMSLEVSQKFNDNEREFIRLWIDYRNIVVVASMMNVSNEECQAMLSDYRIRNEIDRISIALTQRRFATRLMNMDEIEGYLTSMITDENVPYAERLTSDDKLKAIKLLMDAKEFKKNMIDNPDNMIDVSIDTTVKDMSIDSIKLLLSNSDSNPDKKKLIDLYSSENSLSPQEIASLNSMSSEELLKLVEKLNDKNKK